MNIGKQMKKYRTAMKLSQEDLSEKVFVSRQTISNWENYKSYPDIKSLVLLSSIFNVSLDVLVKGDLEVMKKEIQEKDIKLFKSEGTIFSVLLLAMIILPIPLVHFLGTIGFVMWCVISIIGFYYAFRVEKYKKNLDIQTYKEIVSFVENKDMNESEKNQEIGKRPYQKSLLAIGSGLITLAVALIMAYILRYV